MDINEDEQSLLMGEEKQIEEEGIISPQVKEESSGWSAYLIKTL